MKKTSFLISLVSFFTLTANAFTLKSPDIYEGFRMPKHFEFNGFGCNGANLSPALVWSNPPAGTKSYAITAFDPDAPTGSGFWHWVVINIPKETLSLKKGMSGNFKNAIERINDYGIQGYGGACPPKGDKMHRYEFTVWALPTETLDVPATASNAVVGFNLNAKALGKKTLTATYVR